MQNGQCPYKNKAHRAESGTRRKSRCCDHDKIIKSSQQKASCGKPHCRIRHTYIFGLYALQYSPRNPHRLLCQAEDQAHPAKVYHYFFQARHRMCKLRHRLCTCHMKRCQYMSDQEFRQGRSQPSARKIRNEHQCDQPQDNDLTYTDMHGGPIERLSFFFRKLQLQCRPYQIKQQEYRQYIKDHLSVTGELISDMDQDTLTGPLFPITHIVSGSC